MSSHKTRQEARVVKAPVEIDTSLNEYAQVVQSQLKAKHELAIADDLNMGGDPYNSTGSHCIIKPQRDDDS